MLRSFCAVGRHVAKQVRGPLKRAMSTSLPRGGSSISIIPCLDDNYSYLVHNEKEGIVAVVDPSESGPVERRIKDLGLGLDYILNTHHHHDHVGGNLSLKETFGAKVVGPAADRARIPGLDVALAGGDVWSDLGEDVCVFDTPGHTVGHAVFYMPESSALFAGDTLFSLGCGRLFEGTPHEMLKSLQLICELPPETLVYCGHEYTESNVRFAVHVDPDNMDLKRRVEQVREQRAAGQPTVPTTLETEMKTNPFLRAQDESIRERVGMPGGVWSEADVFAKLRAMKDIF